MIRLAGIAQFSRWISLVGEPLMPSLRSSGPTEKPGSSWWTANAEMPWDFFAAFGSLTAITVYQLDRPALVIQHLVPLSTQ